MAGFIGNYELPSVTGSRKLNTLACKLVTGFQANSARDPPLPNIIASIVVMNPESGQMEAVVEGTEITKWRTAAASLVSTQALYFNRPDVKINATGPNVVLAIIGCGVQGESHAKGFAATFGQIREIRLWNRTSEKAMVLLKKLEAQKHDFKNSSLTITICDNIKDCVRPADIIVTATSTADPLVHLEDIKQHVHINGQLVFGLHKRSNFVS